jgi:recombination protein RecA
MSAWRADVDKTSKKDPTAPSLLGHEPPAEAMHTGSATLDGLLGGGWPRGKFIMLSGPESSGKSTLAYQTVAELHRRDPEALALLIDSEGSFDPQRASRMGIDMGDAKAKRDPRLMVLKLKGAADVALEEADQALKMRDPDTGRSYVELVVIDSIASLVPKSEAEGEIGDQTMALLARLMSQMMRKFNLSVVAGGSTIILINQIREKMNVMYGSNETIPGGRSLRHYPSLWIDTRAPASEAFKNKDGDPVAILSKFKVKKNKVNGRFGTATIRVTPRRGFDFGYEVAKAGIKCGLVTRGGSFYSMTLPDGTEIKEQGEDAFITVINKLDGPTRNALYDMLVEKTMTSDDFYAPDDIIEEEIVPVATAAEGAELAAEGSDATGEGADD